MILSIPNFDKKILLLVADENYENKRWKIYSLDVM